MNIIVKKEIAMDAIFKKLVGVIVTNKIHLCLIVIFKKPNIVVNKKMISLNKKKFCLDGAQGKKVSAFRPFIKIINNLTIIIKIILDALKLNAWIIK